MAGSRSILFMAWLDEAPRLTMKSDKTDSMRRSQRRATINRQPPAFGLKARDSLTRRWRALSSIDAAPERRHRKCVPDRTTRGAT